MKNVKQFKTEELSSQESKDYNGGRLFKRGSFLDTVFTIVGGQSYEDFNNFLDGKE